MSTQEPGDGVTQAAGYLCHPGLSERGTSWSGCSSSLSGCLASSCVIQLVICLFKLEVF